MHVEVKDYEPAWATQFEEIRKELEIILQNAPDHRIEHVGSTSVPGLAAKPVIDIDIITTRDKVSGVIDAITKGGRYASVGDMGILDRYAIRPVDKTLPPPRNIYVIVDGCQALRNHLAIRDACRISPQIRDKYAQVKRDLAAQEWESLDEYCKAKTKVLTEILEGVGFGEDELEQIRRMNM